MQNIRQIHPGVYQYHCLHFSPQELDDLQQIGVIIARDLQISGLRKSEMQNSLVIMDFLGEAISAGMAQPLADTLRALGVRVAGVFMVPNTADADYPWISISHWCANHSDWFARFQQARSDQYDLTTDRKLICLNRRPSLVRSRIVDWIRNHMDESEVIFSLESISGTHRVRQRLLDGPVDEIKQHRPPPEPWLRAAIKLITEGNEQGHPNVPETVLVSEKTFKCFAWRQFPVWVSVPGTVKAVRDMGFDVFDDVFDGHAYDEIQDQDQRIDAVLAQLQGWIKQPTWRLQDLRQRHHRRLQKNFLLLKRLARQRDLDLAGAHKKYAKMFADNHPFRV